VAVVRSVALQGLLNKLGGLLGIQGRRESDGKLVGRLGLETIVERTDLRKSEAAEDRDAAVPSVVQVSLVDLQLRVILPEQREQVLLRVVGQLLTELIAPLILLGRVDYLEPLAELAGLRVVQSV